MRRPKNKHDNDWGSNVNKIKNSMTDFKVFLKDMTPADDSIGPPEVLNRFPMYNDDKLEQYVENGNAQTKETS
jgi:hypothetical protein